jgi:hypothetical protein
LALFPRLFLHNGLNNILINHLAIQVDLSNVNEPHRNIFNREHCPLPPPFKSQTSANDWGCQHLPPTCYRLTCPTQRKRLGILGLHLGSTAAAAAAAVAVVAVAAVAIAVAVVVPIETTKHCLWARPPPTRYNLPILQIFDVPFHICAKQNYRDRPLKLHMQPNFLDVIGVTEILI